MTYVPLICALVSFGVVWWITPWLIRYLWKIGLVVKDQNKKGKPLIPLSGGLGVLAGVFSGLMLYIFIQTFYYENTGHLLFVLAAVASLIMITLVGFIDDLIIRRDKNSSGGLKQWQKPLLTLSAAIPLMVVNAGVTTVVLPMIGRVNLGLLYPLIIIPLIVVGSANMVNLLAGFNGLEVGMGIIYVGSLGLFSFVHGRTVASLFSLILLSALIAFYFFNKYPAKIFPGDSLTYLLGGGLAIIAILGNIERAAFIVSIPFFIELILKLRGNLKKQSYGTFKNGKVHSLYDKVYSLPHFITRTGRFTEKQVVYLLFFMQFFFSSLIWVI